MVQSDMHRFTQDEVDLDELRARLRKMTDDELVVREDSVCR